MDSRTVGPYLVFIRLAQTTGYNLFITNEPILMEVLELVFSNRVKRSTFCVCLQEESKLHSVYTPKAAISL